MAFHEVRFPDDISRGARGGPERRTQIVELASRRRGAQRQLGELAPALRRRLRHPARRRPRRRRRLLRGAERPAPWLPLQGLGRLQVLPALGRARRRRTRRSAPGDGATTAFQLTKRYSSGAQSWTRTIAKPVAGTVRVALGGAELTVGMVGRHHDRDRHLRLRARRRRRGHRRLPVRRAGPLRHRPARRHARPRAARLDHLDPARGDPAMKALSAALQAHLDERHHHACLVLAHQARRRRRLRLHRPRPAARLRRHRPTSRRAG